MSWTPITGSALQYMQDSVAANNYYIKFYASGTTTPISMATDSTGGTLLAKAQFNAQGYAINGSSAVFIPHIDQKYKVLFYPNATDADANTFANAIYNIDAVEQFAVQATGAENVKNFATLAAAVADTSLVDGDALNIAERTTGNGGGAMWDVVLSSTVTENTFNIVQCTGVATLSLVLRIEDATLNLAQIGATTTGDWYAAWNHALSLDEVSKIILPRTGTGTATLSATITIDKAVRIEGAGSCSATEANAGGQPGTSTTKITCTGTNINGIELVGSGTEGTENIHLSDFSLWGSATMNDGIQLGTSVLVTKSSMKNVHVRGFTKTGKLGVRFSKCLEFLMENVYTQSNYYGMGNLTGDVCTTMRMVNCHSRTNTVNGTFIGGTYSGGTSLGLINEGNIEEGIEISPGAADSNVDNDWYGLYSEANASGLAPIVLGNGAGVAKSNRFFGGGSFDDATADFGGKSIYLDRAEKCVFDNFELTTVASGFMSATANTNQCQFRTPIPGIVETDITGNALTSSEVNVLVVDGRSKIKSGTISRDISAVDGAVNETGLGFLPKSITFFAAVDNTSMMSMGVSDGTVQYSVHDTHGVTVDTYGIATGTILLRSAGGTYATGTITIDTIGQFTITWAKTGSPTGTATIFYTAHG